MRTLAWVNSAGFLGAKALSYRGWKADLEMAFLQAFAVGVQGVLDDVYHCGDYGVGNTPVSEDAGDADDDVESTDEDVESTDDVASEKDDAKDNEANDETTDSIDSDAATGADIDSTTNTNDSEVEIDTDTDTYNDTDDKDDTDESFPIEFMHSINPEDDYNLKHASKEEASHHMLESNLISLYRSAHTCGKHKLQIKLRSRPISAEIQSLFVLPFLTRKEVEDNVALKHSYRNIIKALHQANEERTVGNGRELNFFEMGNIVAGKLDEMSEQQMKRRGTDDGIMQLTVVAQVAIACDEVFVVRDRDTGDVVQGDANEVVNEVTHLVRFEIVVDMDSENGTVEIGSWQITDWDDLLDGNTWFV